MITSAKNDTKEKKIKTDRQNPNLKERGKENRKKKKKKPWLWGQSLGRGWNLGRGGDLGGMGPRQVGA